MSYLQRKMGFFKICWENYIGRSFSVPEGVIMCIYCDSRYTIPPMPALYANPTPQLELFSTAAIIPAHLPPCLERIIWM